jgi:aspartate dehydrogenase
LSAPASGRAPIKVGIVGVGTIGQTIAAALDGGKMCMVLVAVADQQQAMAERFAAGLKDRPPVVSLEELVRLADLVVEAAGQAALPEVFAQVIGKRKDLMILSVGGLLGHEDWFGQAEERGCRIYVPSGAIAGLDGLKAAARGGLESVTLTSRKPVSALRGVKYIVDCGIDLDGLKEDTVIFEGRPEEACRAFPTTSNVAASLRLAVGGLANVSVRIVASPRGTQNVHEIQAQGEFGRLRAVTENVPSENNPRTSRLAAFSALATLDGIARTFRVGT